MFCVKLNKLFNTTFVLNNKMKNDLILKLIIICYLIILVDSRDNNRYKLNSYDITIKINGSGYQSICYRNYGNYPNQTFHINGTHLTNNTCKVYLGEGENVIIMKWDNKINGNNLFYNLPNIMEINLSGSAFTNLDRTFRHCTSVTSIDFSNVDTSSVTLLCALFEGCSSLKSIDLSNLNLSNVNHMHDMFNGCVNLRYINFPNYNESQNIYNTELHLDRNVPSNLVICIDPIKSPKFYNSIINNRSCTAITCDKNWKRKQKNAINCQTNEEIFQNFFNSNISNSTDKKIIIETLINYIKNATFNDLILIDNETLLKQTEEEIYQIASLRNQFINEENITSINLGNCENTLKGIYNTISSDELIMLKIAHIIPGYKTQIIEYSFFDIEGTTINLSICENDPIEYHIPFELNEDIKKYDPKSDFYNDICNQYDSDEGIDMSNYDRKFSFNKNNMSLCESNCEFKEYNEEKKKVICDCKIKSVFNTFDVLDKDQLIYKFSLSKKLFNIEVIKCFKLLFSKKGIVYNIGNYINLTLIIINIIFFSLFCIKGYNSFRSKIKEILIKTVIENKEDKHIKKKNKKNSKFNWENENTTNTNKKQRKKTDPLNNNKKKNCKISFQSSFPPKRNKSLSRQRKSNNKPSKSLTQSKSESKNIITEFDQIMNSKISEMNDYELNFLDYKLAIKYDMRTFCQFYFSLIRMKHLLFFSFLTKTDYNPRPIKYCSFFTNFSLYFAIKTLFFNDSTMHTIYENSGVYDIIIQLPQIIYSSLISTFINSILSFLSNSEKEIVKVKNNTNVTIITKNKYKKLILRIKRKFIFYYILNFLLLFISWF